MTKAKQYKDITDWLQSGSYADGVTILETVSPKHPVLALLKQVVDADPGSMHFDILKNRLELEMYDIGSHLSNDEKEVTVPSPLIQADKTLGLSGAKIVKSYEVNEADLPDYLKAVFARTKELTPLIARLHTELADENLPEDVAAEHTSNLLALDNERAQCWEKLDAWAEKRDEILLDDDVPDTDETDPVKKGVEIAKRIERLKENISRTQKAIEDTTRANIKARNENKLKAYQDELAELQTRV